MVNGYICLVSATVSIVCYTKQGLTHRQPPSVCCLARHDTPSADGDKIKRKVPAAVQQLLSHEATLEGMRRRNQVHSYMVTASRSCDADLPSI